MPVKSAAITSANRLADDSNLGPECVTQPLHVLTIGIAHCNDIKSARCWIELRQVQTGAGNQFALLARIYARETAPVSMAPAHSHFDEDQYFSIPDDEVNFTDPAAPVARDDYEAHGGEESGG